MIKANINFVLNNSNLKRRGTNSRLCKMLKEASLQWRTQRDSPSNLFEEPKGAHRKMQFSCRTAGVQRGAKVPKARWRVEVYISWKKSLAPLKNKYLFQTEARRETALIRDCQPTPEPPNTKWYLYHFWEHIRPKNYHMQLKWAQKSLYDELKSLNVIKSIWK